MKNNLSDVFNKISDSLMKMEIHAKGIEELVNQLVLLDKACVNLSQSTSQLDGKSLEDYVKGFNTFSTVAGNVDKVAETLNQLNSDKGNLAGVFEYLKNGMSESAEYSNKFANVLKDLHVGPVLMVTAGLAALTGVFYLLQESCNKQSEATKRLIEDSKKLSDESSVLYEKQSQLNESVGSSWTSQLGKYEVIKKYANELIEYNGQNADAVANVQDKVNALNSYLGESVVQIENGTIAFQGNTESVLENIEAMKIRAMISANEEAYGNALLENGEIVSNMAEAEHNLAEAQEMATEKVQEYIDKGCTYEEALGKVYTFNHELKDTIDECRAAYDSSSAALAENQLALDKQSALELQSQEAVDASKVSVEQLVGAYVALTGEYDSQLGKGNEVSASWDTLSQKLNEYGEVADGHTDKFKTMTQTEIDNAKEAKEVVIKMMAEKAIDSAQSYDEMTVNMGNAYKKMSEEEKRALKEQYDMMLQNGESEGALLLKQNQRLLDYMKKHNIDVDSEQGKRHINRLKLSQEQGAEEGQKYLNSISQELQTGEKPTVNIDNTAAKGDIDELQRRINGLKGKTVGIDFKAGKSGFKLSSGDVISISTFASGGFPSVGEMFIAREAGPELVGRINSKTAVANNDQIITGISAGVYNALRHAMAEKTGGSINLNATLLLDGEAVGKQVIKYHNGVVRRTGTSPLFI